MNGASHKESWFGSFGDYGGRKSSFSLGQEQSSSGNQNLPVPQPVTN